MDQKSSLIKYKNSSFYLPTKGWHINTQSWTDANVVNSLKGKIISKKELLGNSYEVLVLSFFILSNELDELNYELIDNFLNKNTIDKDSSYDEISSKEKKFLDKYVNEIIENYEPLQ